MGTYNIIPQFPLKRYTDSECLTILRRLRDRLLVVKGSGSSGEPGQPSVQAETGAVEALGISEEQMAKLDELIAIYQSATKETTANLNTTSLQALDEERCHVVNYMVRRILDYKNLPIKAEQEAGKQMEPAFRTYNGFYERGLDDKTNAIDGFIEDARKPEFADSVATLGIESYLEEAERLNNEYKKLAGARDTATKVRRLTVFPSAVEEETQDLLDDIFMMANAHSLVNPSDEATDFINEMNNILAKARTDRKKREGQKGSDDKDTTEPTEQPDTETPDTEQPDTEEPETPDTETPGTGTETPEEPDDRPVVQ